MAREVPEMLAGGQDNGSVCVHRTGPSAGAPEQIWRVENAGSATTLAV